MESAQKADLRDSLAAERTFLAWIRTGLALTGFGFVVARFGPYLREFQFEAHPDSNLSHGMSLLFGTALIGVGVVVYVLSAWHHFRLVRELERGGMPPSRPSIQAIVIALFLALVGIGMAIYLNSLRRSVNPKVSAHVSYNRTQYLGQRHGLPRELLPNIAVARRSPPKPPNSRTTAAGHGLCDRIFRLPLALPNLPARIYPAQTAGLRRLHPDRIGSVRGRKSFGVAMSLREFVGDAIYRWLVREPLESTIGSGYSVRSAKPNRVTSFNAPMRCPACSYEWLCPVNLEQTRLSEAVEGLGCPRCGSEPARIRTDRLQG